MTPENKKRIIDALQSDWDEWRELYQQADVDEYDFTEWLIDQIKEDEDVATEIASVISVDIRPEDLDRYSNAQVNMPEKARCETGPMEHHHSDGQ